MVWSGAEALANSKSGGIFPERSPLAPPTPAASPATSAPAPSESVASRAAASVPEAKPARSFTRPEDPARAPPSGSEAAWLAAPGLGAEAAGDVNAGLPEVVVEGTAGYEEVKFGFGVARPATGVPPCPSSLAPSSNPFFANAFFLDSFSGAPFPATPVSPSSALAAVSVPFAPRTAADAPVAAAGRKLPIRVLPNSGNPSLEEAEPR